MRESPAGILHPDRSRGTAGTFPRSHFSLLERSRKLHPAELTCLFTGRNEGTAAKWPSPGPLLRGGKDGGRAGGSCPGQTGTCVHLPTGSLGICGQKATEPFLSLIYKRCSEDVRPLPLGLHFRTGSCRICLCDFAQAVRPKVAKATHPGLFAT